MMTQCDDFEALLRFLAGLASELADILPDAWPLPHPLTATTLAALAPAVDALRALTEEVAAAGPVAR